jgi:uncharacterized membrane protein YuzA (DUF378 family)
MRTIWNMICLPIVILGALNYGAMGIFDVNFLSVFGEKTIVRLIEIVIGFAGLFLAMGWHRR